MTWLFERPLFIVVMGGIGLALLTAALVQTGKRSLLVALLLVALLTGGLVLLERTVVTDREKVEATLFEIADALEKNDVDAVVAHISADSPEIRKEARLQMGNVTISEVTIKNNLEIIVEEDRDPPLAVARFNGVIHGNYDNFAEGTLPRFFQITFRLEEGKWRIVDYKHLDPVRHE